MRAGGRRTRNRQPRRGEGDLTGAAGGAEASLQEGAQGQRSPKLEGGRSATDTEGTSAPDHPTPGEAQAVQSKGDNLSTKSSHQPSQSTRVPGTLKKVKSDSAVRFRRFLTSVSSRLSRKRSFQESAQDQSQQDDVDGAAMPATQPSPISLVPSAGVPVWDVNNCALVNGQMILMSKDDESACRIRLRTSSCLSDTSLNLSQNC
ncbi:uncharacterized protein LOC119961236, partial [Scyliorhinus canicula]|uniref:uncharacterized protein LOC119961236 n=1 Tax=Scyliorhinus canicula TaxID=7830 RepID=UPI0018F6D162